MNQKAGNLAPFVAWQIDELADFGADMFILHAKGDEDAEANATEREGLRTRYQGYKSDFVYSTALAYGGIEDASIYSILDNMSHYGEEHECQTADHTLDVTLPSHGETSVQVGSISHNNPEEVYDLSGRKVGISLSRLPKGIYIMNGRRVVIK